MNLKTLNDNDCNISALNVQFFSKDALPNLKVLNLRDNHLQVIEVSPSGTSQDFLKMQSLSGLYLDKFETCFFERTQFKGDIEKFIQKS